MHKARFSSFVIPVVLLLLSTGGSAWGKVYIDIDSPAFQRLPIAIAAFQALPPDSGRENLSPWFSETIAKFLDITGFFTVIDRHAFPSQSVLSSIDFADWKTIGADYLVNGSYSTNSRNLTVEFRLFDVIRGELIVGKKYTGPTEDRERIVLQFASEIMSALTGGGDIFATEIAFVKKNGRFSDIYAINFCGTAVRGLTRYGSLTLSPRWSPDGKYLSFTSYREGNPDLYIRELATGVTKKMIAFRGLNLPGAWSPDKKKMLFASNKDGNEEIYLLSLESGQITRLTDNPAIDLSPVWSPDGTAIAFVSNRSGSPQIYLMNRDGGNVRRLTFSGSYNTSPSWSPLGGRIAYESRTEGSFHIFVIAEDGSNPVQLTAGGGNYESPTWSPDGRYLAFSREGSGRYQICIMNASGSNMRVLYEATETLTSPSWSPGLREKFPF